VGCCRWAATGITGATRGIVSGDGIGHFFGAMRIDAFRSKETFKSNMDRWIERFRSAEPVDPENRVQVPGDQERACEKNRLANGVPLFETVLDDLNLLAKEPGIETGW